MSQLCAPCCSRKCNCCLGNWGQHEKHSPRKARDVLLSTEGWAKLQRSRELDQGVPLNSAADLHVSEYQQLRKKPTDLSIIRYFLLYISPSKGEALLSFQRRGNKGGGHRVLQGFWVELQTWLFLAASFQPRFVGLQVGEQRARSAERVPCVFFNKATNPSKFPFICSGYGRLFFYDCHS